MENSLSRLSQALYIEGVIRDIALQITMLFLFALVCGCTKKSPGPSNDLGLDTKELISKPLPPEKSKELVGEAGRNWLYGEGFGNTALSAGSIFLFPPYGLLILGNAIAEINGYEPVWLSDALPEEERDEWRSVYRHAAEAPGRTSATLAGEEFRTKEIAKERIRGVLSTGKN